MSLPRNLDQDVCTALMLWCQQNVVITAQIPTVMIFDCYRTDIPIASNMMLTIRPMTADEDKEPLYHYGWLRLDFIFSTQWVREAKTTQALNIESIVMSQIKQSANASLIDFMNQYVGGLQNIGLINKTDYRKLYTEDLTTTSKIEVDFKYRINWDLYQFWLNSYQCDIESPNIPIYDTLTSMDYIQVTPDT